MTKQRDLKALIRQRMSRTGESYLTARRHVLHSAAPSSYVLHGGLHPESAALANSFANRGVDNPLTGRPIDEATILGVGGGLGAGYILWEFDDGARRTVTTGFRNQWQYPQRWFVKVAARLGIEAELLETAGPKKAADQLDRALADGSPIVAAISAADIGYWHMPPDLSGWLGYPVVVYGRTGDGRFLVDDRNRKTLTVAPDTLAAARGRITSYKNRLLVADPAAIELDTDTFVAAVRTGIEDHLEHLGSSSASFSLPAFRKWSTMLVGDGPKAWPTVFADGRGLLGALVSTVEAVDSVGILGGNLRSLYADFCASAGPWIDRDLTNAAEAYRRAASAWTRVAEVAHQVTSVQTIVRLDGERRDAVADGDAGAARARAAAERSHELLASDETGLSGSDRTELFAALAGAISAAAEAENVARSALAHDVAPT